MDFNKPALQPPSGIEPNFDSPPNRNVEAHFAIAIGILIVFTGASLRAYSKIFCMKQVHLEDYVGLVALAPYIAFIIYTNTSLFQATMGTIKTAVLLEWTRIFVPSGTRTIFWWTCQIVMWVNMLYYTTGVIISAISCSPHEKIWHPTIPGRCFNTKAFFISNAALNLASDIIILALPQRVIWTLKMPTQKKIGVSVVFAVGVIASLVGAGRLTRAVMYYLSNDNLYNVSSVFLWCTAELSVAFLVFCLPAVPKIFSADNRIKKSAARLRSWSSSGKTGLTSISKTDQKVSTWNSSTFSKGPTLEAAWGSQSKSQYARVASHSTLETYAPDAMKNCVPCTASCGASEPYVQEPWPGAWLSRHDPSTSWYEEAP
ncbi:hypothetical protein CHU98_g2087 [Xylaria longipes]|nr:hypothetical protein CHU98_g2087 [Xylaria longipes]